MLVSGGRELKSTIISVGEVSVILFAPAAQRKEWREESRGIDIIKSCPTRPEAEFQKGDLKKGKLGNY